MEGLAILANILAPVSEREIGKKRSVTPKHHSAKMCGEHIRITEYTYGKVFFAVPNHLKYQLGFQFEKMFFYLIEGNQIPMPFNWVVEEQELCYAETGSGTPFTRWEDVLIVPEIHIGVRREKVGGLFKYTIASASTDAPKMERLHLSSEPKIYFSNFWAFGENPVDVNQYNLTGIKVDASRWFETAMPIAEKEKLKLWGIIPPDVVEEWSDHYFVFNGDKIEIADPADFSFEMNRDYYTDWNRINLNRSLCNKEEISRYQTKKGLQTGVRLFEDGKVVRLFDNRR